MSKPSVALPAFIMWLCFLFAPLITHADTPVNRAGNPHFTPAGFFDLHVCHWADRPDFFLVVFTTERMSEVKSVEVILPGGRMMMSMNLARYREVPQKNRPTKHALTEQFTLPSDATDGWYSARITLHNGEQHIAKDYIILHAMELARGLKPSDGTENIPVPEKMLWDPVPGASHYKVYIHDIWEGKLIHESKLLNKPHYDVPPGLIKPGGDYFWRVHARDADDNVLLGDFNHGSFTDETRFSTAP